MQIKPVIVTQPNEELNENEFFDIEDDISEDELEEEFYQFEYIPAVTKNEELVEIEKTMVNQVSQKVESISKAFVAATQNIEQKIETIYQEPKKEKILNTETVIDAVEDGVPVQISVEILPTTQRLTSYSSLGQTIPYTLSVSNYDSPYVGSSTSPTITSTFSPVIYSSSYSGKSYMESLNDVDQQYSISLPSSPIYESSISSNSTSYVQTSRKNDPYCFAY